MYKGAAKGADLTNEDVVLAIGGYKSAFLANLVTPYLFEMIYRNLNNARYKGIYRDDGLTERRLLVIHHKDLESHKRNDIHQGGGEGM
eukprot:3229854-Ditylum_brightwellii.AAC.1